MLNKYIPQLTVYVNRKKTEMNDETRVRLPDVEVLAGCKLVISFFHLYAHEESNINFEKNLLLKCTRIPSVWEWLLFVPLPSPPSSSYEARLAIGGNLAPFNNLRLSICCRGREESYSVQFTTYTAISVKFVVHARDW